MVEWVSETARGRVKAASKWHCFREAMRDRVLTCPRMLPASPSHPSLLHAHLQRLRPIACDRCGKLHLHQALPRIHVVRLPQDGQAACHADHQQLLPLRIVQQMLQLLTHILGKRRGR